MLSNLSVLQGQSRRVQVEVKSVQESGTLPLMEECILSVGIGCVKVRPLRSPKIHESCHVSFCACSVLFERQWPTRVFETLLPLPLSLPLVSLQTLPWREALALGCDHVLFWCVVSWELKPLSLANHQASQWLTSSHGPPLYRTPHWLVKRPCQQVFDFPWCWRL